MSVQLTVKEAVFLTRYLETERAFGHDCFNPEALDMMQSIIDKLSNSGADNNH